MARGRWSPLCAWGPAADADAWGLRHRDAGRTREEPPCPGRSGLLSGAAGPEVSAACRGHFSVVSGRQVTRTPRVTAVGGGNEARVGSHHGTGPPGAWGLFVALCPPVALRCELKDRLRVPTAPSPRSHVAVPCRRAALRLAGAAAVTIPSVCTCSRPVPSASSCFLRASPPSRVVAPELLSLTCSAIFGGCSCDCGERRGCSATWSPPAGGARPPHTPRTQLLSGSPSAGSFSWRVLRLQLLFPKFRPARCSARASDSETIGGFRSRCVDSRAHGSFIIVFISRTSLCFPQIRTHGVGSGGHKIN